MDKEKHTSHKGKLFFRFASFWSESEFSLRPVCFYLSMEVKAWFLRFF